MPNAFDPIPSLTVQQTTASVSNQGYTYNQAGFTYNQLGVNYGGVYKVGQDAVPEISMVDNIPFSMLMQDVSANTFYRLLENNEIRLLENNEPRLLG